MDGVLESPGKPAVSAGGEAGLTTSRMGWFSDLWRHRELLYFLAWRDVKVRYKQAALGAAWAVLQPLCTMLT
ncbi:MAG: ABC transporter permease, partial [Acidimicrobiales bacterium]